MVALLLQELFLFNLNHVMCRETWSRVYHEEATLKKGTLERVWAGLLSTPLSNFQESALYANSNGYANLTISYVGTLTHSVSVPVSGYENSVVKV